MKVILSVEDVARKLDLSRWQARRLLLKWNSEAHGMLLKFTGEGKKRQHFVVFAAAFREFCRKT